MFSLLGLGWVVVGFIWVVFGLLHDTFYLIIVIVRIAIHLSSELWQRVGFGGLVRFKLKNQIF